MVLYKACTIPFNKDCVLELFVSAHFIITMQNVKEIAMSQHNSFLSSEDILRMEDAEYGDLDHTVISKRHVRILSALYQVAQNIHRYDLGVNYVNIPVLLDIIEVMFGKRHTENDIWLFTKRASPSWIYSISA
ncbi:MAG: hypothetical protein RLZZ308_254 [Candidatus Parcubacteria bacterium]